MIGNGSGRFLAKAEQVRLRFAEISEDDQSLRTGLLGFLLLGLY